MSEATSERVLTERRGPILIVTINRPEARNAFDDAAMDLFEAEDELFIAIITGAGGNFSAGADLKAAATGGSASRERPSRGGFGVMQRPPRKQPRQRPQVRAIVKKPC